ncbi:triose-phosphate transporter family-domain-containing protein [Bisporella sp. PMI_857]|nr:triose-phosphate transporter family-domain-containing protein [Bisporella sp. PMI_857]
MLPTIEAQRLPVTFHPAVYVVSWIVLSSITILFNKYILSNLEFSFPAILTCWHLLFATVATQVLAKTTTLLDGRKSVKMTGRVYLRAIVPLAYCTVPVSCCSNQVYLYLSVAFIQMLKASAPMAVLVTSWLLGVANPKLKVLLNVSIIVFGVALASYGEIDFVWLGFFFQVGGIVFEAIRLVMIQILLSGDGQNMDPLVSLYYYAPVSAIMNFLFAAFTELPSFQMADIWRVGSFILILNAAVAFMLNVSSVFLIGKTSGLVMTLCGVLKNILLVAASVLIWGTIITWLQFSGMVSPP